MEDGIASFRDSCAKRSSDWHKVHFYFPRLEPGLLEKDQSSSLGPTIFVHKTFVWMLLDDIIKTISFVISEYWSFYSSCRTYAVALNDS